MTNARVLVVEDEQITALDIERSLNRVGYDVVKKVSSGEEAILEAGRLSPDIVLMDIVLEGELDGVTAAAQIRDRHKIPVVYLTAHADLPTIERAQITEPDGYLLKPFHDAELRAALQVAMYRKRSVIKNNRDAAKLSGALPTFSRTPGAPNSLLDQKLQFLKSLDFFSNLSDDENSLFASACVFRKIEAGETIVQSGEIDPGAFVVVSGRISIVVTSQDGKALVVEMLPPGDLFGLIAAIESGPAPLTIRAQINSEILSIPKSTFLLLLDSHPTLARHFSEYLVTRLRKSQDMARIMAHCPVATRVATAILSLLPTGGSFPKQNCTVEVTRQDLADLTGSAVETVIRTVKEFEREGILRLGQRRKITVVDPEKLEHLASSR